MVSGHLTTIPLSQVLDQNGVGQLIKMATEKGRAARPSLKVNTAKIHEMVCVKPEYAITLKQPRI